MTFCVLTPRTPSFAHICAVTDPVKREYCKRHGYTFEAPVIPYDFHNLWANRQRIFRERLDAYDWVLLCGGDVLLTNHTISLQSLTDPKFDFIIAKDALQYQADVVFAHGARGTSVIDRILSEEARWRESGCHEQDALDAIYPEFKDVIKVVPQRTLQGYEYSLYTALGGNYAKGLDCNGNDGQWRKGDFALHVPAHPDRKEQILRDHLPLIVR